MADPQYPQVAAEVRRPVEMPAIDKAVESELIEFPAAAAPHCMEAHRRVQQVGTPKSWEHLLHHETRITLALVSVQRAIDVLVTIQQELAVSALRASAHHAYPPV
jgi:hypothetical protein